MLFTKPRAHTDTLSYYDQTIFYHVHGQPIQSLLLLFTCQRPFLVKVFSRNDENILLGMYQR